MDIVIIGSVVATIIIIYLIIKVANLKQQSRTAQITAFEVLIQGILDKAVLNGWCDRALVLKMHNGGGKMYTGVNKYASVLFEGDTDKMTDVKDDFQKYLIDSEYMDLMQRVSSNKIEIQKTTDLKYSMLRRRYEADDITHSIVFFIEETENAMYYGSFTSISPDSDMITGKSFAGLEAKMNKLRNAYQRAKKKKILF